MVYDYISPVIIVVPLEHQPIWQLSEKTALNLNKAVRQVAEVFIRQGKFPNFFTGGNINNAKYGLSGVHAHVHIEPREMGDPSYPTFPAHANKRMLTKSELDAVKQEWKILLNL